MSSSSSLPQSVPDLGTRIVYMVLFGFVFWLLCWAVALTAIGQLLVRATTQQPSEELTRFGSHLSAYLRHVAEYLTFATEIVPYPFSRGGWPG